MQSTSIQVFVISLSFLVSVILTIMPLPEWGTAFRPEWVALVLIYWCMALPNLVGVGVAWLLGLLVDAAKGALLGQHALGFAITAYITIYLHQRVRVYPLSQQIFVVGFILLPYMSLTLWVKGIRGEAPHTWLYWAPLLSSMLLWPFVFMLLRALRRHISRQSR
jgi:rod shape-determining protein MreD